VGRFRKQGWFLVLFGSLKKEYFFSWEQLFLIYFSAKIKSQRKHAAMITLFLTGAGLGFQTNDRNPFLSTKERY